MNKVKMLVVLVSALLVLGVIGIYGNFFNKDSNLIKYPAGLTDKGDNFIGAENAPVTIVEFSDFQCPYCGKVEPTIQRILNDYNGKVKVVYRDYPLSFHQFAQKASESAECAGEQGKFWEMHGLLFQHQDALDVSSLKSYATSLGLDESKFAECLDSGRMAAEVKADTDEGAALGVTGTPAFFINGVSLVGAQPYNAFVDVINKELAKGEAKV